MPKWFSSLLPLACEQPSRQHKLNVMIVHAPSNNGKYAVPCPINHLLENKNKLVLQRPSIDLSIYINCFKNSLAWWSWMLAMVQCFLRPQSCLFVWGYVHTVPDRFLLRFKSCSDTVLQKLFRSVPSVNRSPIRYACNLQRSLLIWKDYLPKWGFVAISAPIKVFRLDSDRFKNLSDTERSTFNSGAEQYCSGAETASKAVFLVWTEALSGTLSATLRFTVRYSVNIAWLVWRKRWRHTIARCKIMKSDKCM